MKRTVVLQGVEHGVTVAEDGSIERQDVASRMILTLLWTLVEVSRGEDMTDQITYLEEACRPITSELYESLLPLLWEGKTPVGPWEGVLGGVISQSRLSATFIAQVIEDLHEALPHLQV